MRAKDSFSPGNLLQPSSYMGPPLVAQLIKNLPASAGDARDMGLSLGPEDPLEKEMATHSSILACRINSKGRGAWCIQSMQVTKETQLNAYTRKQLHRCRYT